MSFCTTCGKPMGDPARFCPDCGAQQVTPLQSQMIPFRPVYSTYYEQQFTRIKQSGEVYKGQWNWVAFLFGPIWALTKGLWAPAFVCFLASVVTYGLAGVVYWFIFGARGNWMYYNKELRGQTVVM
jgi:zinc-ribbon domain/Protein of unknown function (DUF2628)